ncbi:MAG: hypothetical protein HY554_02125, partial [Elusimicrobia bacterium]|nr:hypothetical protein [Elusimicrobiota bacterium]
HWAFDDAAFASYAAPLASPAEGSHWLRYYSVDLAGNAEEARNVRIAVDASAPVSELSVGSPRATLSSGELVISPRTLLSASASDPASAGAASGVAELLIGFDESPLAPREGPFAPPSADGPHALRRQAVDNVGNVETLRVSTIHIDGTPPVTTLAASPDAYQAPEGPTVGAAALLVFAAEDPAVNQAAAGVHHTELALDGGTPAPVIEPLGLEEGSHVLAYRSVDNVGNAEAWREARYRRDATAPLTTLSVGGPVMRLSDEDVLTPETPLALSAADPVSAGVASGVRETVYRIDGGAEQAYAGAFRLPLGRHTVAYRSTDRAGNAEPERSAEFAVQTLDAQAPRTSLELRGPRYGADPVFVTPAASFALSASDDRRTAGDGAGVGVASTHWAFDDQAFASYAGPIAAGAEGSRWLRFFSVDLLGNAEAPAAVAVAVDGTPPASELTAGAPQAVLDSGELVVASHTLITAGAADPLVAGVASGVAELLVAIDGAPLAPYAGAFALPAVDGPHIVRRRSADNLGNVEALRASTLYVDATAPATTLSAQPQGVDILPASNLLSFAAEDPAVNGSAAGVHHTEYALDGAEPATVSGSLALEEGSHTLRYRSLDNVANAEAWREASFRVDATPPLTALSLGSPVVELFGRELATTATPLALSAEDPVAGGLAAGVLSTVYRVDGGPERAYAGPFTLPAGSHTVAYRSTDRAGNAEEERTAQVEVSAFLAESLAAVGSVTLSGGASVTGRVRAGGDFSAGGKSSVDGDVIAASIRLTGKSAISGQATQSAGTVAQPALGWARAAAEAANDNASVAWLGDSIVLSGQVSRALPAGTYFVRELRLSGGASLSASGPARLFVAGPIQVSGGATINEAGAADDLWVFSDGAQVSVTGHARMALNLLAPAAAIAFSGGGTVAGRVLGATVSLSGHASRPSDNVLPARRRGAGEAKKLAKAAAGSGGGTATKARGKNGEVPVRSAKLDGERPEERAPQAEATAAAPKARETLP